eukprot:Opistho-2@27466
MPPTRGDSRTAVITNKAFEDEQSLTGGEPNGSGLSTRGPYKASGKSTTDKLNDFFCKQGVYGDPWVKRHWPMVALIGMVAVLVVVIPVAVVYGQPGPKKYTPDQVLTGAMTGALGPSYT